MPLLSVTENFLYFLSAFGILQGLLLSGIIYFHQKGDKSVNIFLALYILFITGVMSMPFILNFMGWRGSAFIMALPVFPGIMLYFYLRSFKENITWKKILPHFISFIVITVMAWINLSAISKQFPDANKIPVEALSKPFTLAVFFTRTIVQFAYYFLSVRVLKSYRLSIKNLYSETSRIDLRWAGFLINGYLILNGAFLLFFPLALQYPHLFNTFLLANMALATPYIYIITYKGYTQPAIWQLQAGRSKQQVQEEISKAEEIVNNAENTSTPKTEKPAIQDGRFEGILQRISVLMEKEKLYQEPELTLQVFAEKVQFPAYQVSQAINEGMNKTFYDLINGYRVEEAKRLLTDEKNNNFTILSVGFEAGFNSKTTFNTVFKKFTGMTPTEYRTTKIQTYVIK